MKQEKEKKDFHRSRVRAAPVPPSLRAGGACASRPGGEEKILVFFSGFIFLKINFFLSDLEGPVDRI